MNFIPFSKAIKAKFDQMAKGDLFIIDVDMDVVWNMYLDAFPAGTNEIFKERREYDCNCCKNFIRRVGNVVSIKDGSIDTIWNVQVDSPFAEVAAVMDAYISGKPIKTVYLDNEHQAGADTTRGLTPEGDLVKYNHFCVKVPNKFYDNNRDQTRGRINSAQAVFKRGLEELSVSACDSVIDLINSESIYRGAEHKASLVEFRKMLVGYSKLNSPEARDIFVWSNINSRAARFRNTVIGTLVTDITDGVGLTSAVGKFETKVAPANYKRSSSLITPSMIKTAMKTVDKLGIESSLKRRFAAVDDISINNVLFADRAAQPLMKDAVSLGDMLMEEATTPAMPKTRGSIPDVTIDHFMNDILPTVTSLDVLVQNNHVNNFMSVVAPMDDDAKGLFTWDNNFSWSYNNNMTDSDIKTKVRVAGGNVDNAVMRVSLSWFNTDDLDIHVIEPNGNHIYFGNSCNKLDVDMNVNNVVRDAVENVSWTTPTKGGYRVYVNNYTRRESIDVGFVIELECNGVVTTFTYNKPARGDTDVMEFTYDGTSAEVTKVANGISQDGHGIEKNEWGIKTERFTKVSMMMLSPNFWDGQEDGNKHFFFILDKCLNPEPTRGIYNEFLIADLREHRKVFEIIGDKTKCAMSDTQLSGVGFSSTKSNDMTVRVDGGRMMNIKF